VKATLLTLLAATAIVTSATAQNLITNGDFETGLLTPWIGGTVSADPAGGFFATTSSTISQTVPTTAGTQYLFSGSLRINGTGFIGSTASMTAVPSGGGAPNGTRPVSPPIGTTGFIHASLLFTASTASTTLTFSFVPFPGFSDSITVDNVTLLEVAPGKLAGRYSGNNVTTLSLTTPELSNKTTRKVTARITDDNRIYILDGTQAIFGGIILNDGTFDLSSPTVASASGTAKIRGKRIELEFGGPSLIASDFAATAIPNTVRNRVVLTRR
jgi:hypothetical protein